MQKKSNQKIQVQKQMQNKMQKMQSAPLDASDLLSPSVNSC